MAEWESMSVDEYAALEQRQGAKLSQVNGIWWRRVRPFFYRPLQPLRALSQETAHPPRLSRFGGFQYQVAPGATANSWLHYLVSTPAADYSPALLGKKDARLIRVAQKRLVVRRISLEGQLVTQAHQVYLEFYQRTRYSYKSNRKDFAKFSEWASILRQFPKLMVLGAFLDDRLRALSVSCLLEDTVLYSTFFAANDVLKSGVSDLMLHSVRQAAAETPGVRQVFATMLKGSGGTDSFYLYRGFQIMSEPAFLRLNPALLFALRLCAPGYLARLVGEHCPAQRPPSISGSSASMTGPVLPRAH